MSTPNKDVREAIDATLAPRRADYADYLAFPVTHPLSVERAELLYVMDSYGNQFLDCSTGALVNPMGHANQAVWSVVLDHLRHYGHTTNRSHQMLRYQVEYATALASSMQLSGKTPRVLFCEGERDALLTAVRLAFARTSDEGLMVHHGAATWLHEVATGSPWITLIPPHLPQDHLAWDHIGAVLLDLMPGGLPADKYWVQQLVDQAKRNGVPVIIDESRTGFGRTGRLWAFEQWSIDPDYVVLGGPVGGGLPFGAVVAPHEDFTHLPEPATMAGFPVAAAAGMAVFSQLTPPLLEHVRSAGTAFEDAVVELVGQFPHWVSGQSGLGLLRSIRFVEQRRPLGSEAAQRFWFDSTKFGLLMDVPDAQPAVAYTPPLIISENEVRRSVDAMAAVLLDWEPPP